VLDGDDDDNPSTPLLQYFPKWHIAPLINAVDFLAQPFQQLKSPPSRAFLYLTNMSLHCRKPSLAWSIPLSIMKAFFVSCMAFDYHSSALWVADMAVFCDNLWM